MTTNSNAGSSPVDRKVMHHTPGPWTANISPQGGFDIEKDPNELGRYMVLATLNAHESRADEMHANAHLIAASPELLEALQSFMFEFGDKANSATVAKARAAIAKATGLMHNYI